MNKKLLKLIGGTLMSGMLLVGCGVNDDDQNPPPEDLNNGDQVEDDNDNGDQDMDLDMNDNDNDNLNNDGTNGTNGTDMNGTNGDVDLLDDDENKRNTGK
jgi:hypothetical protein